MKSAVIAFLTCLLVFCVQGQEVIRPNKCRCPNGFISSRISKEHIKGGPVVRDPSVFCPRTEIIITIIGNKEKCVNPESKLGQLILTNRHRNRAVSTTMASNSTSVQTTASSLTSVHSAGCRTPTLY